MSGAANKHLKQTTLKIGNPTQDAAKNANADELNSDDTGNRQKRTRYAQEVEHEHDNKMQRLMVRGIEVDDVSSDSNSSLFTNDSVETIKSNKPRESKDPNPIAKYTQDTHKRDAIRLERLRDKRDRYSSHIEFLKECRDNKVIPKGLKIDVEPSIGNYDQEFCADWYTTLQDFSITLIGKIIAYSEKIETATHAKITTETERLTKEMSPEDLAVITDIMDTESS